MTKEPKINIEQANQAESQYQKKLREVYSKIVTPNVALRQVQKWQQEGNQVVITDVVCDLYHKAHSEYFLAASLLGDRLLVRADTDAHVAEKKDPEGPIFDYQHRTENLAHIPYIDIVTSKSSGNLDWIKFYKPNVLIKSTTSGEKLIKDIDELKIILKENNIDCNIHVLDHECNEVDKSEWLEKAIWYEENKYELELMSGSTAKQKIIDRNQERNRQAGFLQTDIV